MLTDEIKKNWDILHQSIKHLTSREIRDKSIEFAKQNSPVDIGDLVSDHTTTVVVTKVFYTFSSFDGVPMCYYFGIKATKKGVPNKSNKTGVVYQTSLRSVKKYIVRLQDMDGHWYCIPKLMAKEFKSLVDRLPSCEYVYTDEEEIEYKAFWEKYEKYNSYGYNGIADYLSNDLITIIETSIEYDQE